MIAALALIILLCFSSAFVVVSDGASSNFVFKISRVNLSNDTGGSVEPYVAAGGSNVYVAWIDSTAGNYRLYFRASNNDGQSFNPLYVVSCPLGNQNCNTAVSKSGNIQILAEGNHVVLVWKEGGGIYESASSNAGANWTKPVDVSASVSGSASSPVDAIAGSHVYIAWVQSPPTGFPKI